MKFSTREEIEASQSQVFEQISDFALLERLAMRRGAQVRRIEEGEPDGLGRVWDATFRFRGKMRTLQVAIAEIRGPELLRAQSAMTGLDSEFEITLVPLAPSRTRMILTLEMRPKSMPARLLLQSMKLAKGSLTSRFKTRVEEFARGVEERARMS